MATIAGAQLVGLSRAAALEFSFFVSMPTMAAATLNELKDFVRPKGDAVGLAHVTMGSHQWVLLTIGLVISFIVALAVIAWFMSWVRRRGFVPFAIYRIVLGIAVLIWLR
jgi:undecaprenyl-diphosphatase